MTGARMTTLAQLRGSIERIETHSDTYAPDRVSLGHAEADAALQGGLARGTMHEVFAEGRHSAAATGFVAGLAHRVSAKRPLLWIRQDFSERECGALAMSGWRELGLDPRLLVTVRAPDVETALRTTADALACDALGSVVLETWGDSKQFDLVATWGEIGVGNPDSLFRGGEGDRLRQRHRRHREGMRGDGLRSNFTRRPERGELVRAG